MNPVGEALRQVIEGGDFDPPEKLLHNVKADKATTKLEGFPYSIATNVAHADHWNRIWLAKLTGTKAPPTFPDFPAIEEADWDALRTSFQSNLQTAYEMAHKEDLSEREIKQLLKVAIHTSYHLGQIKLLKRLLKRLPSGSVE